MWSAKESPNPGSASISARRWAGTGFGDMVVENSSRCAEPVIAAPLAKY